MFKAAAGWLPTLAVLCQSACPSMAQRQAGARSQLIYKPTRHGWLPGWACGGRVRPDSLPDLVQRPPTYSRIVSCLRSEIDCEMSSDPPPLCPSPTAAGNNSFMAGPTGPADELGTASSHLRQGAEICCNKSSPAEFFLHGAASLRTSDTTQPRRPQRIAVVFEIGVSA